MFGIGLFGSILFSSVVKAAKSFFTTNKISIILIAVLLVLLSLLSWYTIHNKNTMTNKLNTIQSSLNTQIEVNDGLRTDIENITKSSKVNDIVVTELTNVNNKTDVINSELIVKKNVAIKNVLNTSSTIKTTEVKNKEVSAIQLDAIYSAYTNASIMEEKVK